MSVTCLTRVVRAALVAALACIVPPTDAFAQGPAAPWRTTHTAFFRFHYPESYEAWTLRLAARLDAMRERLGVEIGHVPDAIVDVVVMDPVGSANGYALPVLGAPRMVLWTTPPSPDVQIGHYGDWAELLALHEDAHLVQLLRPSRNPFAALLQRTVLPIGPITTQAPRWVIEGYATLLEGELTGMGRPYSDMRAAILRRWAQQGRLPAYGELSGTPARWLGQSMPYLAGSAYLEWLQDRTGDDSLRHLWARMTARTARTFDEAFRGVFGESPSALYGRFAAELARDAMQVEAAMDPVRHDGELWQRFDWSTSVPAVSPDGRYLAMVRRVRDRPARLVVLATGPDEDAERRRREAIERMLARDPEDVAPVILAPAPRTPAYVLPSMDGAEPLWPRWMPDGRSLLFVRLEMDTEGVLRPDLYRWYLEEDRLERITRSAGLHRPDPAPDGTWAVAVRHRSGGSQLVRVDLTSGDVEAITPPSVDVVYDSPRLGPDGTRLAVLRNAGEGWRAIVTEMESGAERELPVPATTVMNPAWSADGRTVFLSVGARGFIDIHAVPASGDGEARPVTRSHGAALGAAPAPDGGLYFLSLESHGLDVRWLPEVTEVSPRPVFEPALVAVVPAAPPVAPVWQERPVGPGERVRVGRQEWLPLAGGAVSPAARAFEVGARGGDLLGRLDYLAVVSLSTRERGPAGVAIGGAWRGWRAMTLGAQAFWAREAPSRQPVDAPAAGETFDVTRRGLDATLAWQRRGRPTDLHAAAGVLVAEVAPADASPAWQTIGSVGGAYRTRRSRDQWSVLHGVRLRGDVAQTGDDPWQRLSFAVDAGVGHGSRVLTATLERRAVFGAPAPSDRILVGGMPSTILPPGVLAGRRLAPPVPAGVLVGDEHRAFRAELRSGNGPVLHYERHQTRDRRGPWSEPVAWVGLEVHVSGGPWPLLRLPGAELRTGVARLMDAPVGGRVRWWAGLRWFP